jgi:hypothetical protein
MPSFELPQVGLLLKRLANPIILEGTFKSLHEGMRNARQASGISQGRYWFGYEINRRERRRILRVSPENLTSDMSRDDLRWSLVVASGDSGR